MRKLNIALIISEFEDPHTNTLCQGVARAVREMGYQLFIYPAKFLDAKSTSLLNYDYEYHNNCLFQFVSENLIDVAIVNLGNIAANADKETKLQLLQMLKMPVILIADKIEGYSSVNFDNSTGMVSGIEHLIRKHNKKHIGYVSGPMHNLDAVERRDVFEQVMIRNRFVSEQYRIVVGDFTSSCTEVIEELLDSYPEMDALVCGNDMMCFGAYQVLRKRGLVPGKDIAVMGYDDVPYAKQVMPGLSTVRADSSMIGHEAVKLCEKVLAGEIHNLLVDTTFVIRESCGCARGSAKDETGLSLEEQADIEALNLCLVDISQDILNKEQENCEICRRILQNVGRLNVKSVYLYAFEQERMYRNRQHWDAPETVILKAYYKNGAGRIPEVTYRPMPVYYYPLDQLDIIEVPETERRIPFKDILSNKHIDKDFTGIKVITMLYAGEVQYGFMVWEVEENYFSYISKLTYQISNTIKTNRLLQNKNQMAEDLENALIQVREKNAILEEISKIDELTQIYNRRGFLDHMKRNVISKENKGKKAVAMYADMDDLKLVNDRFGHEEGDYALRAIGQILHDAVHSIEGKGEVGRVGGDEFCAYIITELDNSEEAIRRRIDAITEDLNNHSGKPFYVSFSIGMHEFVCSEEAIISQELDQADEMLYQIKFNKKKNILR